MRRFTDTLKWDDPWFRQLPGCHKLVFLYIVDRCNNAGFWEVDEDAICWHTKIEAKHLEGAWKGLDRGIKGASGWVWVRRFLKHQKNEPLNPDNPAHRQIISLISEQRERFKACAEFQEFVGAYKGLFSPIGIGKGTGKGKRESPERVQTATEIYYAYPRQVARKDAIKSILSAIDRGTSPLVLLERTKAYAQARKGEDEAFTPYPATWFNQERFNDDAKTWSQRNNGQVERKKPAPTGAAYKIIPAAREVSDEELEKSREIAKREVEKLKANLR